MTEIQSSSFWGEQRVFYVPVRHMPMGYTFTLPVKARTVEEAKQKAVEWPHHRDPGAYEYYELA